MGSHFLLDCPQWPTQYLIHKGTQVLCCLVWVKQLNSVFSSISHSPAHMHSHALHPSAPSLSCVYRLHSPCPPDGKPLSHLQLFPSLCSLHVISHYVLSALILNRLSHLFSFSFSLPSSYFRFPFSLTWSWKPNWPSCLMFFGQSKASYQPWWEQLPSQRPKAQEPVNELQTLP